MTLPSASWAKTVSVFVRDADFLNFPSSYAFMSLIVFLVAPARGIGAYSIHGFRLPRLALALVFNADVGSQILLADEPFNKSYFSP